MISGATGALAVVMVALVATHGVQYLFATVVLMGILQILAGIFRLGKFIRMVPHPVMLGFVNGLAIVIFLAQLGQFKVEDAMGNQTWMTGFPVIHDPWLSATDDGYYMGSTKINPQHPCPPYGNTRGFTFGCIP